MDINKYIENNLGNGWGISKSDLKRTANIPHKKNRIGGLRIFSKTKNILIN